jgi:DNA-binding Lrp family transcriptional regulator
MQAYILLALKETDEKKTLDDLNALDQVREAHVLFGEWDLVAKIDVENTEALGTFMMDNIRNRSDVKLTSTLIIAK